MRSSTILVAVAAALLAAAGVAGLDLVVGGNPAALTGVIGASTSAIVCAALALWLGD